MEIWKYELAPSGATTVPMPVGAEVLDVQNQREKLTIWASVDPRAVREKRTFFAAMTGEPCSSFHNYIGTVQLDGGAFVVHVFEATL